MNFKNLLKITIPLSLIFSFSVFAADDEDVEEVIVTGSYISKSNQNQSVPVDVIGSADLDAAGNPSITDLILNLPSMSGSHNQQDQFQGSGVATGMKNINIRGMGADRGLVLLNGKRIAAAAVRSSKSAVYPVDVGNFPMIAMDRLELLKNGGAVTYGSDAVTGVLNFITRKGFDGFEMTASHSDYDGSDDGDDNLGFVWGVSNGANSLMVAFEYDKRGRLPVYKRSFVDYGDPAAGGWALGTSSFGNPGAYGTARGWPGTLYGGLTPDPKCGYSSEYTSSFPLSLGRCGYNYTPFFNLIDEQERLKFFTQFEFQIDDTTEVYGDVLFSKLDGWYNTSPSFPHTNPGSSNYCTNTDGNLSCTSAIPYFNFVPLYNPGAIDFLAGLDQAKRDEFTAAGGIQWWGRTLATAGPSQSGMRTHETMRWLTGVRKQLGEVDMDASITYTNHTVDGYTYDPLAARVQDSLSGLAGHGCPRVGNDPWASANDSLRGNNAVGCYFYNPFGSAIDATAGSALYNDPSVKKYYDGLASSVTQVEQAVTEVIFNGDSDMELGGGNVSWAAGYQYRWWDSKYDPTGDNRVDGPQRSPFVFLGVNTNSYIETRVHSFFGELNLPISDAANLEVGVRHEDYGADTVTKPKFAVLWDVTDKTTFRASYEQTFRVPTMPTQETTSLELYAPAGEYIQIKTPVPTALGPEESTNIGFGFIYRPVQGMTVNVDYYSLALEGPFNREAATCVCSVKMTADGTVYDPATDTPQAITSIIAELINGDDVDTAGIDVEVNYSFVSDMGVWSVGGNMNHILEYEVSGAADGSTYDAAGLYNLRSTVLPIEVRSMPDLKMNAYVGLLTDGGVDARLFVRFIDEVKIPSTFDVAATFPNLTSIDDHMTFDFHATKSFMDDSMDVTLSVMNLTDEDPPLTPHELAYDAYTHNPLGRILKVGFKYKL